MDQVMRNTAKKLNDTWNHWTPDVLSVMRIMSALLILQFGTAKILQFPMTPNFGNVQWFSLTWFAGSLELVLGALLLIGLFSRTAAFVLAGEMAFAYFIGHASRGFFPLLNGGTLPALFCFVFFYLAFAGPGPWSVDALRARGRELRFSAMAAE
jgi:putative oxidoreductase